MPAEDGGGKEWSRWCLNCWQRKIYWSGGAWITCAVNGWYNFRMAKIIKYTWHIPIATHPCQTIHFTSGTEVRSIGIFSQISGENYLWKYFFCLFVRMGFCCMNVTSTKKELFTLASSLIAMAIFRPKKIHLNLLYIILMIIIVIVQLTRSY